MVLLAIFLVLVMYLSPTMVAFGRDARRAWAIAAANVFLGWTVIGWIITLVWSVTSQTGQSSKSVAVADIEDRDAEFDEPSFEPASSVLFRRPLGEPRA